MVLAAPASAQATDAATRLPIFTLDRLMRLSYNHAMETFPLIIKSESNLCFFYVKSKRNPFMFQNLLKTIISFDSFKHTGIRTRYKVYGQSLNAFTVCRTNKKWVCEKISSRNSWVPFLELCASPPDSNSSLPKLYAEKNTQFVLLCSASTTVCVS